ncbi:hypothetical protein [Methylobacterium gregans]|uniref:hypothetical protein n=1 Tax=Methylobacterium gregans TaxID=374424 RepID=UPI003608D650
MRRAEAVPRSAALCLALALALAGVPARAAAPACLRGVNLSGPEFGTVPGRYGTDYAYPSAQTIARFGALGLTGVRLPVRWERLQPRLGEPSTRRSCCGSTRRWSRPSSPACAR